MGGISPRHDFKMDLYQKVKAQYPFLTDEQLELLLGMCEIVVLQPGDAFVKMGERSSKGAMVIEGLLRNYTVNDNAEEVTVVFAGEMQSIAPYACLFLNKPATETTEAVEPSVLCVMDYQKFKALSTESTQYARIYIDFLEKAFVASIERVEDLTKKKPEQRYKNLLEQHGHLIERVPLKYLASYLGITPVSLSRIRKRLAKNRN